MDWQRFIPGYWSQNYPTCRIWDQLLNEALDTGNITTSGSPFTIRVDGIEVWVENWPYGYGMPRCEGRNLPMMPTVATRKRLRAVMNEVLVLRALGKSA